MKGNSRYKTMRTLEERYMLDAAMVSTAIHTQEIFDLEQTLDSNDLAENSSLTSLNQEESILKLLSDTESQQLFHNIQSALPVGFVWELSLQNNQNWSTHGESMIVVNTSVREKAPSYGYISHRVGQILPLDLVIETMRSEGINTLSSILTPQEKNVIHSLPFFGEAFNPSEDSRDAHGKTNEKPDSEVNNGVNESLIYQGYKLYHGQNIDMYNQPRYHINENNQSIPSYSVVKYSYSNPFESQLKEKPHNVYENYSQKLFPEILQSQLDAYTQDTQMNNNYSGHVSIEETVYEEAIRMEDYKQYAQQNELPFFNEESNEQELPNSSILNNDTVIGVSGLIGQVKSYAEYFDNERQKVESHIRNLNTSDDENKKNNPSL